jgi:hypothetical protein
LWSERINKPLHIGGQSSCRKTGVVLRGVWIITLYTNTPSVDTKGLAWMRLMVKEGTTKLDNSLRDAMQYSRRFTVPSKERNITQKAILRCFEILLFSGSKTTYLMDNSINSSNPWARTNVSFSPWYSFPSIYHNLRENPRRETQKRNIIIMIESRPSCQEPCSGTLPRAAYARSPNVIPQMDEEVRKLTTYPKTGAIATDYIDRKWKL